MTLNLCRSLIAVVAFANAAPVYAQDPQTSLDMAAVEQAWSAGDFVQARKGLAHLAETQATPLTQYRYGRILIEGRGGPQNVSDGITWLEKAVAQNHLEAATLLARVVLSLSGEARDPKRAAALFTNAAARGNAEAQYYLGLLHQAGTGVEIDPVAAFNWFLASSEGFNPQAQFELSKAYATGDGTTPNQVEALRWLQEAANSGVLDAQYSLAISYEQGAGIGQSERNAIQWYKRAAEAGHILSQRTMGTKYMQGLNGDAPDAPEALRWLTAAANAGDPGAMNNLAIGYAQGTVFTRDDALAVNFYKAASDLNLGRATLALAGMTEIGRGTEANIKEAIDLYQLAATQGADAGLTRVSQLALTGQLDALFAPHDLVEWIAPRLSQPDNEGAIKWMQSQANNKVRSAQAELGTWLLTQDGRSSDAIALLENAATAGHVPSQFRLGMAFSTGDGAELDYIQSYAWLNIAAASGHKSATETRGLIVELMTTEQLTEAQNITRSYFQNASSRAPQTEQTVTKVTK
ncbi:MAG: tetratricopeptide repeat protein [Roseobacter sp.]